MSLEHAILGFLQYGPSSGYDLKEVFDLSVQHFWPADQSQIYRTLSRLEEHGWAEREVIEQEERPDKKVYHITEEGRQELRGWLTTPLPFKGGRSAPLIQVFFAGQLSDEELLTMFRRAAEQLRQGLAGLQRIPDLTSPYTQAVGSPREVFCWMLTLECGMRTSEAYLAWLESVIARLENGEIPPK
ncbi:MAG TPA: PadR family transcriptional regulator, partial [Armatimonadota bacterium]|jgi:DNA-binding PadR family transcriptional regulator